ncbi:Crp/Fnr family transcriptional regulator [Pedobacter sp. AW1-32]|uniref:Crp/Fnr family transcriptional regulator n=1 Tax=Pedobacter sp. AW1-32 TaxID=3383026 RepID=UPI003FEE7AC4
MTDILFEHIELKVDLSQTDKELIVSFFEPKKIRKRQYLLQAGEQCKYLTFVSKGLLRTYNVDDKGNEHMSVFGSEGWWLSDFNSFLTGAPSMYNIDAIEDAELLLLSKANFEAITLKVPIMDRFFRILFQNSIVTKERRLTSSISHTAKEKYLDFISANPNVRERIPQHLIASYLGIAPETISRIKKDLLKGKH